ncbi:MAG: response regulator [Bdellovibrionales bacterium]|nr:response regulator [Bdellovibrionales bacterium]
MEQCQSTLERTGRILVAEDCPDTQAILEFMLEPLGAKIEFVDNGKECLEKVHEEDFSLIVLDVKMPVIDGVETLRKLRKEGYQYPVVALTASASVEAKHRMEALGIEAFLSKLEDRKAIIAVIGEILERERTKISIFAEESLPIYPEVFPRTATEHVELLQFLSLAKRLGQRIRQAAKNQALNELRENLAELQQASHFGYYVLDKRIKHLLDAIVVENGQEIVESAAELQKTLLGVLAGRRKVEQKGETRGFVLEMNKGVVH